MNPRGVSIGVAAKEAEIPTAVNSLEGNVKRLEGVCVRLGARLESVMRPQTPTVGEQSPEGSASTMLSERISSISRHLGALADNLEDMLCRLEL